MRNNTRDPHFCLFFFFTDTEPHRLSSDAILAFLDYFSSDVMRRLKLLSEPPADWQGGAADWNRPLLDCFRLLLDRLLYPLIQETLLQLMTASEREADRRFVSQVAWLRSRTQVCVRACFKGELSPIRLFWNIYHEHDPLSSS